MQALTSSERQLCLDVGKTVFSALQDCVFGQYSVRCILDQDVLLQEDVELIELLDPSLLTLGSSPSGSPSRASSLPRPSLIATPTLWYFALKESLTNLLSDLIKLLLQKHRRHLFLFIPALVFSECLLGQMLTHTS